MENSLRTGWGQQWQGMLVLILTASEATAKCIIDGKGEIKEITWEIGSFQK